MAVSIVCLIFIIAEVVGGYLASSLAIMSDAAHLLSDVLGFVISLLSIWLAKRKANVSFSYGFHRAEIIGALSSVILIWGLTILICKEAYDRIINIDNI